MSLYQTSRLKFIGFRWLHMHQWVSNSSSGWLENHSSPFWPVGVSSDGHSAPDPVSWMMPLRLNCDPVEVIKASPTLLLWPSLVPLKGKGGDDCLVIKRLPIPAVVCMVDVVGTIHFSHQLALSALNSFSSDQEMTTSSMLNLTTSKNASGWVVYQPLTETLVGKWFWDLGLFLKSIKLEKRQKTRDTMVYGQKGFSSLILPYNVLAYVPTCDWC